MSPIWLRWWRGGPPFATVVTMDASTVSPRPPFYVAAPIAAFAVLVLFVLLVTATLGYGFGAASASSTQTVRTHVAVVERDGGPLVDGCGHRVERRGPRPGCEGPAWPSPPSASRN